MKEKKAYEAPCFRKVRLEVKSAVLAECRNSPDQTPMTGSRTCKLTYACPRTGVTG